jgi:signal transduction histidine kinase
MLARSLSKAVVPEDLLFSVPIIRDTHKQDPGFRVELDGDFSSPEEYWTSVERSALWVLEIRSPGDGSAEYSIAPTKTGLVENPFGRAISTRGNPKAALAAPAFDARIFLRPGTVPTLERGWAEVNSGVRIYLEGFRVLPYGESGNDWLSLDQDYTRRSGTVQIDPLLGGPEDDLLALQALATRDVSLRLQPNRNFYGAVFLTDSGSSGLQTLVNREGFVPNAAFQGLSESVRVGLNLMHRAWALAGYEKKQYDKREAAKAAAESLMREEGPPESGERSKYSPNPSTQAKGSVDVSTGEIAPPDNEVDGDGELSGNENRSIASEGVRRGTGANLLSALTMLRSEIELLSDQAGLNAVRRRLEEADASAIRMVEDASLLRVLASVGSQLAAFTHEVNHLLPLATAAENQLKPVSGERWPSRASIARTSLADLRRALERQASYLVDVSTSDARRRRVRLNLKERIESVLQGFASSSAVSNVELRNEVGDVRTPPMYRSELQAIVSNLVSNGVKAAAAAGGGIVEVSASANSEGIVVRVQNSGQAVVVSDSESLFSPFVSTSIAIDPVLGQGMGLGLPITRELVSEYGGYVRFVDPTAEFATAVEVGIPN